MDPIDGVIDDKEATWTEKASTRASRIEHCREQFANATLQKTDPSSSVGTSDAAIDIEGVKTMGVYGGDYDIIDKGDLSYHPSNGSDKVDSVGDLSLGDGAKGTYPPANARNFAGQSLLGRQNDDLPDWLQEMIDNQAYRLSHLLSAPVAKCFPCITCKNRINEDDPRGWICIFLRKSGGNTWEVFDKIFEEIGPDMDWDGNDGL